MVVSTDLFNQESMDVKPTWKTSMNTGALVTPIAGAHHFLKREYRVKVHMELYLIFAVVNFIADQIVDKTVLTLREPARKDYYIPPKNVDASLALLEYYLFMREYWLKFHMSPTVYLYINWSSTELLQQTESVAQIWDYVDDYPFKMEQNSFIIVGLRGRRGRHSRV